MTAPHTDKPPNHHSRAANCEWVTLLKKWEESIRVMHVGHHLAASRYAKYHQWFGGMTAAMSTLVSASVFNAFTARGEEGNSTALLITGCISLVAALFTALNTFLKHDGRANAHFNSATLFQALLRQVQEEMVHLLSGDCLSDANVPPKSVGSAPTLEAVIPPVDLEAFPTNEEPSSYEKRKGYGLAKIRHRWTEALRASPPLPQSLHDKAQENVKGD